MTQHTQLPNLSHEAIREGSVWRVRKTGALWEVVTERYDGAGTYRTVKLNDRGGRTENFDTVWASEMLDGAELVVSREALDRAITALISVECCQGCSQEPANREAARSKVAAALAVAFSTRQAPCETCAQETEELRVAGPDHRNTADYDGSDVSCPDCDAPWPPAFSTFQSTEEDR